MAGRQRTGDDPTRRGPGGSRTETKITDESELGSDIAGTNKLQGEDQRSRHHQRQTWPDEQPKAGKRKRAGR